MFQSMGEANDRPVMPNMEETIIDSFERDMDIQLLAACYVFKDVDELIPVAKRLSDKDLETSLYQFEDKYYLNVNFEYVNSDVDAKNMNAIIREYLQPSKMTIHRLEEYGKVIIEGNCFETINEFF